MSLGNKKDILVTAFLFLLSALQITAQDSRRISTDNRLKNYVDSAVQLAVGNHTRDSNFIGISIGIYKDGRQFTYNYGEIKKGSHVLPGSNDLYDIGSVAKVFVTTMLAKAVIDKKADLNNDIRNYLPGKYPNLSYKNHPVKLVNLANHTSGLPDLSRDYTESTIDSVMKLDPAGLENFYAVYTADSLLKDMHHFTVDTVPGTKYRYNGNAMEVLLLLIERIYHAPYEKVITGFLQSHFKMYNTKITLSPAEKKRLVPGYDENGEPQPYVNFNGYRAAPGINSTINDMLKFIAANIKETNPAIKLAHQPTYTRTDTSSIGLGWMIEKKNNERMIYHSGRGSGITTLCTIYPEKHTGFIIISNDGVSEGYLFRMEELLKNELYRK